MPAQKKKARPKLGFQGVGQSGNPANPEMQPLWDTVRDIEQQPNLAAQFPAAPADRLQAYQGMSPQLQATATANPRTFGLEPPAGPRLDPSGTPYNTGSLGIQSGALPTYPGNQRPLDPGHAAQPNLGPIPQLQPEPSTLGSTWGQHVPGRLTPIPSMSSGDVVFPGGRPPATPAGRAAIRQRHVAPTLRAAAESNQAALNDPTGQTPGTALYGPQLGHGEVGLYPPEHYAPEQVDDRAQLFNQHMQWINDQKTAGLQPMENRRDMMTARASERPVEQVTASRMGNNAPAWRVGAAYGPEVMMGTPEIVGAQQEAQQAQQFAAFYEPQITAAISAGNTELADKLRAEATNAIRPQLSPSLTEETAEKTIVTEDNGITGGFLGRNPTDISESDHEHISGKKRELNEITGTPDGRYWRLLYENGKWIREPFEYKKIVKSKPYDEAKKQSKRSGVAYRHIGAM